VRRAFADRFELDYSSLFAVPAATVDAGDHVAGWRGLGEAFDATQHITRPIVLRGELSRCAVVGSPADRGYRGYSRALLVLHATSLGNESLTAGAVDCSVLTNASLRIAIAV
jgi:hypothetical protein